MQRRRWFEDHTGALSWHDPPSLAWLLGTHAALCHGRFFHCIYWNGPVLHRCLSALLANLSNSNKSFSGSAPALPELWTHLSWDDMESVMHSACWRPRPMCRTSFPWHTCVQSLRSATLAIPGSPPCVVQKQLNHKCQHAPQACVISAAHRTPLIVSNQHLFSISELWGSSGTRKANVQRNKTVFIEDRSVPTPARGLPLPEARCLLWWGVRRGSGVWFCPAVLIPWHKHRVGGCGCPENLQGLSWERVDVKKPRVHTAMSRTIANVLSVPFSSRRSFFQQRTNWSRVEKDIEEKEKGVDGHTRISQIFSSGRLFFLSNNAIHVKTETFRGNMGMSRAFYFGKGKPPEAFKEDGVFQSVLLVAVLLVF